RCGDRGVEGSLWPQQSQTCCCAGRPKSGPAAIGVLRLPLTTFGVAQDDRQKTEILRQRARRPAKEAGQAGATFRMTPNAVGVPAAVSLRLAAARTSADAGQCGTFASRASGRPWCADRAS